MCPGRDLHSTSAGIGQPEPDSACGQLWNRLGHALLLIPTPIPSMREVEALVQRVESPSCSCPPNEVFKPAAVRATATCYDPD